MDEVLTADLSTGNPLYKEVRRRITESLRRGEWKPGEAIPSEKKLAETFGVSIGTLRKAIDELTADNILIRYQGRGTYVATHSQSRNFFQFFHVVRQDGHKADPKVELIEFGADRADSFVASKLGVGRGAPLYRFVNKLSLDGAPAIVDEILLDQQMFPGLTEKTLVERPTTLYQLYQQKFGVTVVRTEERLRAAPAGEREAEILGVDVGAPLLVIIRVARSFDDQPVELRHSYVNAEKYEYFAEFSGTS
ncbi:MAG TPA: GntR family transcriptional regulator [Rhodocyclaceae bacterium]|nr:GntR family transcriptional regulator [Rhodocyclaceae bacterium]